MDNKPLPSSLNNQLSYFFDNYFHKDRLLVMDNTDNFFQFLPNQLRKALLVGYMFDDVFSDFRKFLRPDLYMSGKLLEDLALGLRPRFFKGHNHVSSSQEGINGDQCVIYREGEEVQEMLLITSGEVGVGYSYF